MMEGAQSADWLSGVAGLGEADAERARRLAVETGGSLARAVNRLGAASDIALADALAEHCGLDRATASDFPDHWPLTAEIAPDFLADNAAAPLEETEGLVKLAVADPTDPAAADGVRLATGKPVELFVAAFADIDAAHARWHGERDLTGALDALDQSGEADAEHLKDLASEAPVIRLVSDVLGEALKRRASDVHIEPFRDRLRIRFRIDGVLQERPEPGVGLARLIASRIKIMAGLDIAERRRPQDGRARMSVGGKALDLRVATAPTAHGESLTIRLLEDRDVEVRLDDLGLADGHRDTLVEELGAPYGMILVTGPTGSGKTTTLAGALDKLNAPQRKLISIEDPIEYQIEGVNQIAVNPPIGLTFASVLRSVLRHDPDVIVVGELRDGETAEIAVNAALTGHLVLATVHANTAAGAAPRLIDMGVDPSLLRSTLRLVIAQRLVRVLCPHCREPVKPPKGLKAAWARKGCGHCDGSGYKGRVGVFEFLPVSRAVRETFHREASADEIESAARAEGAGSILDDAMAKIETGVTSEAEVRRVLGLI
jgi:general secretion pathway protein E